MLQYRCATDELIHSFTRLLAHSLTKELAWDINGSKILQIPSSYSHLHEDQVPLDALGVKHSDLLFLIENSDNCNGGTTLLTHIRCSD